MTFFDDYDDEWHMISSIKFLNGFWNYYFTFKILWVLYKKIFLKTKIFHFYLNNLNPTSIQYCLSKNTHIILHILIACVNVVNATVIQLYHCKRYEQMLAISFM